MHGLKTRATRMQLDVTVSCPVHDSFRVRQVAGMFDLPVTTSRSEFFRVELPDLTDDWQIGLVVGPSGSGKTTVARRAFGDAFYRPRAWPRNRAVIDGFGDLPIKQIIRTLSAVGFSSPPAWLKPYHVLSNGERFRCDLARALLTAKRPLVVFDEFTSVVDRTVAKVGSAAVAKAIRGGRFDRLTAGGFDDHMHGNRRRKFVAVSCHYDIAEWLEPDWVVDMASRELARGRLRRPPIRLELFRCRRSAWGLFARHHYL